MDKGKKKQKRGRVASKSPKKPLVREYSAGGVVYKLTKGKTKWLLINPTGTDRWQLPKGMIDRGEWSADAAIREVKEETGVRAKIVEKLGNQTLFFHLEGNRIIKIVAYFLMKSVSETGEYDKKEVGDIKWSEYEHAYARLTFKNDKEMLCGAKNALKRGAQENLI